jgi:predicted acyltransferase
MSDAAMPPGAALATTLAPPVMAPPSPAPAPAGVDAGRAAAPAPRARERLLSLDVFRGMTVAGMLLVNNPGSWGAIYPPLEHAEWHGWTPTDLIFPFFLFIAGITTQLSLGARRAQGASDGAILGQLLKRGTMIFLLGLALSAFPFFQWGEIRGMPDASFLDRVVYRFEHLRIMGVLQRIGLAYLIAGLLTLRTTVKQQVVILAVILYGYWIAMTVLPVPGTDTIGWFLLGEPGHTLDAWLDRTLLTPAHLWAGGGGLRDPEGLLSTLPAAGTVMLGNFAGRWIGQREYGLAERLNGLFAAGALAMMLGLMWHWGFPINKSLWTSSYVLFTGGMAAVTLATIMWVVDVHRYGGWTKPFVIYGVNPMLAFLGSGLMARMIYSILKVEVDGRPVSLQKAVYDAAFASWLAPRNASLAFALAFVGFWLAILWVAWRRNFIFKV